MKVIIIEDEAIMTLFLQDSVEELGHEVVGVFSRADKLYSFLQKEIDIDLVLMDILIKGKIDGIEAAKHIKKHCANALLIFITSYKDSETISLAKEANPNGYLIKPISKNDLEASLMIINKPQKIKENNSSKIRISSYTYNKQEKLIYENNNLIKLSQKERDCLDILIKNKNSYISSETLMLAIWKNEFDISTNSLRELVYRLRKKLSNLTIENSANIGYILQNS